LLFGATAPMMSHDYPNDHQKATRQKGRRRSRRRDHTANSAARQCNCSGRCAIHSTDAVREEKAHLGVATRGNF